MSHLGKTFLLIIMLLHLIGCSTPAAFLPGKSLPNGSSIVVLPTVSKKLLSRERQTFFRRALTRSLESSGFPVASMAIVNSICTTPECPERAKLLKRVPNARFAQLSVESIDRINLVAAYYNSISGSLRLFDADGSDLLLVDYTQRERGGLIFNTGQVLQGLTETVSNVQGEGKDSQAEKFISGLVDKIPKGAAGGPRAQLGPAPKILSSKVTARGFTSSVCIEGDANASAALVRGRFRATLAELSPGHYCGVVPTRFLDTPVPHLELVSSLGQSSQLALTPPSAQMCPENQVVTRRNNQLILECAGVECPPCPRENYLVFSSASERGPFKRAGKLSAARWNNTSPQAAGEILTVVRQSSSGETSAPIVFPP